MSASTEAQYVQLNVGRNVGDTPMGDARWVDLVHECKVAIANGALGMDAGAALDAVQVHMGTGHWGDVVEDSAYISLFDAGWIDVSAVRRVLPLIAYRYGQDAIALIVGSELVAKAAVSGVTVS